MGIALLPTFLVNEALSTGRLLALNVGAAPAPDVLHVVYARRTGVPGKVRTLIEYLRRTFGDPPYWDAPGRS